MLNFKFLNLAKPKKVFEKLNKMDRKQAYTVGAIIVVAVVALLMLASSVGSSDDNPMDGMNPRGYDLAQMPFVNDLAEKELLASRYPDMRENGSSFLYTPAEKQERQAQDSAASDELDNAFSSSGQTDSDSQSVDIYTRRGGSGRGYGYGGRGGGAGRAKTEVGTLSSATMAHGGGSGIGATWGPSVNNQGLQGQTGYVAPAQLKTDDARKTLGQFRTASVAASRLRDNKNLNARKAMQGGNVQGSQAFGEKGIDVSKLGGLALDTSELPKTTDLGNLDDAVDNAVKDQQKKEEKDKKLGFWEQLGQDMLRSFATGLVNAVTTGVGDSLKGWVNGNAASRAAGKQEAANLYSKNWDDLPNDVQQRLIQKYGKTSNGTAKTVDDMREEWNKGRLNIKSSGDFYKDVKTTGTVSTPRHQGYWDEYGKSRGSTPSPANNNTTQVGQGVTPPTCANGTYKTWNAEKQNWNDC